MQRKAGHMGAQSQHIIVISALLLFPSVEDRVRGVILLDVMVRDAEFRRGYQQPLNIAEMPPATATDGLLAFF
jgi:hypothetical protein